jgi:mono/diheme cytochrome c family protein
VRRAALLAVSLVLLGCAADGDKPGMQLLPGMVDSGVVKSFEESPRRPPDGTVAVERTVFAYGPGPAEAARAGAELVNPLEPTPPNLARGKQVFENVCFVCHGPRGEGDGPIIGRFPNPPSLLSPRAKALPDGRIFHVITRGQGIMPPHAAQVLAEDRWKVILHVRALQGAKPPETRIAAADARPEGAAR